MSLKWHVYVYLIRNNFSSCLKQSGRSICYCSQNMKSNTENTPELNLNNGEAKQNIRLDLLVVDSFFLFSFFFLKKNKVYVCL